MNATIVFLNSQNGQIQSEVDTFIPESFLRFVNESTAVVPIRKLRKLLVEVPKHTHWYVNV